MKKKYDIIIVGSGFASTFFLHGLLKYRPKPLSILVIEKGQYLPHFERVATKNFVQWQNEKYYENKTPEKPWTFSIAFGGGSNCWFGSTPRMLPHEFKMKTNFGVGQDWPIGYDDLEEHYCDVEEIMQVAGGATPYNKTKPFPLPAHRLSEPDKILREAYPDLYFPLPTARATKGGTRAPCCNNGVCFLCPIDSKFTIENGFRTLYSNSQIDIIYNTEVKSITHSSGVAQSVVTSNSESEVEYYADIFILGANALFNPWLLLKSGINDPVIGKGLCEQVGVKVGVELDGIENLQGGTVTTGWGIHDLIGEHRSTRAGFMFNSVNRAKNLLLPPKKPFGYVEFIVSIEDFRSDKNFVKYEAGVDKPVVEYHGHSSLAENTLKILESRLSEILRPLPLKSIQIEYMRPTESHIQCTTPMGTDAENSVIDKNCIHHKVRNLILLGSGNFPTASPANPTLTISALSLFAAKNLI